MNFYSRCRRLKPSGRLAQTNGLDFTLDLPWVARFDLFRLVPDHAFRYWHGGRGETQHLALDQDSGEFNAVQLSLNTQAAGSTSASDSASDSASASSTASSRTSIIDLDFSSFIIGEGSVTAFFILMVR